MKVKVCGMRDPDNIRALIALDPDYVGFIFYPQSTRYAGHIDKEILNKIPEVIKRTGVFVDLAVAEILDIVHENKLSTVQLHGNESVEMCKILKNDGLEVIKAAGIHENYDFTDLKNYEGVVDHFLFDTKTPLYGGSGISFDWNLLEKYPYETSYFLSGGISLENIQIIKKIEDERLYALDLNSRFETAPGLKDIKKLEKAITIIRS